MVDSEEVLACGRKRGTTLARFMMKCIGVLRQGKDRSSRGIEEMH